MLKSNGDAAKLLLCLDSAGPVYFRSGLQSSHTQTRSLPFLPHQLLLRSVMINAYDIKAASGKKQDNKTMKKQDNKTMKERFT